jgi:cholinesterase
LIECVIDCNGLYFAQAFTNTYNYRFSVPPGIHAEDLLYTFYPLTLTLLNGTDVEVPVPLLYAKALQSYFISFVKNGDPNVERGPATVQWPLFGSGKNIVDLSLTGFTVTVDDDLPTERCGFWQSAPYI